MRDAARRIDRVRLAVRAAEPVPVAALEWLDPVFLAGHRTVQPIEHADELASIGARRIVAVDTAAHFSRPGPQAIAGLEPLGRVLHPTGCPTRRPPLTR